MNTAIRSFFVLLIVGYVMSDCKMTITITTPPGQCATLCKSTDSGVTAKCDGNTCTISGTASGNCDSCNAVCDAFKKISSDTSCDCDSGKSCFPASATVTLKDGRTVRMDKLSVGDEVLVSHAGIYSHVYVFGHRTNDTSGKYVSIKTKSHTLVLTKEHYAYVNGVLKAAGEVVVGDSVETANGVETVTEVGHAYDTGLYNPHTLHGDIVVNGVRASTYTTAINPSLAHWLLSPLRALYHAGVDVVGEKWNKGILAH